MSYNTTLYINLTGTFLPVLTGAFRIKLLDKASFIFYVLLVLSLVTECLAYYSAVKYQNNMAVYNISNILQAFLIACFFNYSIKSFRKQNIGLYIGSFSLLYGTLNIIYIEPLRDFDTIYFLYQTLAVFFMGAVLLMQIMSPAYLKVQHNPHFWMTTALICFYAFNFFGLALYKYYSVRLHDKGKMINEITTYLNALVNLCFAIVFFFYPKMKYKNAG